MLKANRKLQQIDYQSSYFYQQQNKLKRTRRVKITLLILLPLMLISAVIVATANEFNSDEQAQSGGENPLISSPQLLFNHPNPALRHALPVDIKTHVEVSGLVAFTEVKQVFINPHDIPLEGIYQFPLPSEAAVNFMEIKIGSRTIEGKIMEKQAAKKVYSQAKRQGKKASLIEQQRPNLFTNKIANIPPLTKVTVTLRFVSSVAYQHGQFSLTLPFAITARYQPQNFTQSPAEIDSKILPLVANDLSKSKADVSVKLTAGTSITGIQSDSHSLIIKALNNEQTQFLISLDDKQALADRQFMLSWRLPESSQPTVASFTEQVAGEHYTLLTFFPPKSDLGKDKKALNTINRDVVFIVDSSGSMQGASIEQAKASLRHALSLLTSKDSFNIIDFDSGTNLLFHQTQMVSDTSLAKADRFINNLRADGGTQMYQPLAQALVMQKSAEQSATAIKQIVFITDGAVSNEFELMRLLENSQSNYRLFTVGIGRAPNGYFMKKAAQFGRGSYVFIQNSHHVQQRMSQLIEKISQPVVSNVQLMFDSQVHPNIEVFPHNIPDLYLDEPLQVAIKSSLPINNVQVLGETATAPWYRQIIIDDSQPSKSISTLWARRKIESLLDGLVTGKPAEQVKSDVIRTSIAHQIISPYTSFIAVEKQPEHHKGDRFLAKNKFGQLQESLSVAMPKTALGWGQQLLIGLIFIFVSILFASLAITKSRYARF